MKYEELSEIKHPEFKSWGEEIFPKVKGGNKMKFETKENSEIVLNVLKNHVGHANAISRNKLCIETGLSDRDNRRTIHRLRLSDDIRPIISSDKGYFMLGKSPSSTDKRIAEIFLKKLTSHIRECEKIKKNMSAIVFYSDLLR